VNYLISFQELKLGMEILYGCFAAFISVVYCNVFYAKMIRQLLVEKELEQQTVQLKQQADVIEAQKSRISDELEISKRHLATTLLLMAEKENLLNSLKKDLKRLDASNPSTVTAKGEIVKKIEGSILNEGRWDLFQQQFEQIEPYFIKNLLQSLPKITQRELRLLTLIRMNLNSKEIGDILGISLKSVNTARYRLRKRLELPEEENLELFVHSLK
jgi:ATP/maltotriose-dependent transcriptional regulator MalT